MTASPAAVAPRPSAPSGAASRRGRLQAPWRRLALYGSMLRYGHAHTRDFAGEHWAFFREMQARLAPRLGELAGKRILDLGCGKTAWLTLLLHSAGAEVTGVDTEWVELRPSAGKYWRIARANGLERALRTLAWDGLYAPIYYRALARECGFPLRFDGIDARRVGAAELDLEPGSFDLVVSHEVFEHLPDVEAAVRSLRRVLKPGGLTYVYVHSFTSLSGGHHIAWKYPDSEPSTTVPPWDHLRDCRFPDIPSWINRWRNDQYRRAFERHFEVLAWLPTAREGEALLTPEIRRELAAYSEEELLTKGFVVVATPRRAPRAEAPER